MKVTVRVLIAVSFCAAVLLVSCKSSSRDGSLDILGPSDETAEAAKLVQAANQDLQKIKVIYKENEGKREEIKKALEAKNAEEVKKISDDVVYIINGGFEHGNAAVEKIDQALEMNINDDYREYLELKQQALRRQMEAFENYRQAARQLRNNYDPQNVEAREKVTAEFKQRSEKYAELMEKARDASQQANELYKEVVQRQQQQS